MTQLLAPAMAVAAVGTEALVVYLGETAAQAAQAVDWVVKVCRGSRVCRSLWD